MAFKPIPSTPNTRRQVTGLRYRRIDEKGKPRLRITVSRALLQQVKGEPQFWRLDLDTDVKPARGRLTGLLQDDGHHATRRLPANDKPSPYFSWPAGEMVAFLFPKRDSTVNIANHSVTSMGVEFDLPAANIGEKSHK